MKQSGHEWPQKDNLAKIYLLPYFVDGNRMKPTNCSNATKMQYFSFI